MASKQPQKGSNPPAEWYFVPNFAAQPTREPVWCSEDKSVHFAKVYPLHHIPAAALEEGQPKSGTHEVPCAGSYTSYALFEHPDKSRRRGEFRTDTAIVDEPYRTQLLTLGRQKQETLRKGLLVLAKPKAKGIEYFAAEITASLPWNQYRVRFLSAQWGHMDGERKVSGLSILPLSIESGLRLQADDRGYWPWFPSCDAQPAPMSDTLKDYGPALKYRTKSQRLKDRKAEENKASKQNKVSKQKKSTKKGGRKGGKTDG